MDVVKFVFVTNFKLPVYVAIIVVYVDFIYMWLLLGENWNKINKLIADIANLLHKLR